MRPLAVGTTASSARKSSHIPQAPDFADSLQQVAPVVGADIIDSQSRITSTPTWILDGIRFPACDFTASQVPLALELAHKARADDADAKERIVQMITRGLLNESVL